MITTKLSLIHDNYKLRKSKIKKQYGTMYFQLGICVRNNICRPLNFQIGQLKEITILIKLLIMLKVTNIHGQHKKVLGQKTVISKGNRKELFCSLLEG
jgi:hypothetical protein